MKHQAFAPAGTLSQPVGHEPGRLQDRVQLGPLHTNARSCRIGTCGSNLWLRPRGSAAWRCRRAPPFREIWMFVTEAAPVVDLELVHPGAELDRALRLLTPFLKLEHSHSVVIAHQLVDLLELKEKGTWRRPI